MAACMVWKLTGEHCECFDIDSHDFEEIGLKGGQNPLPQNIGFCLYNVWLWIFLKKQNQKKNLFFH